MTIWDILVKHREEWLHGLGVTLRLCALIWGIGLVAGTCLGAAGSRWKESIGKPSKVVSFILGGMPILVFLFWLHYPLQAYFRVVIDPFVTTVAALAIVNTLLVADAIRGVLNDFPRQYLAAAKVCGLNSQETFLKIQLPIIFRQVIPGLLTLQVTMLHATLFASLISVDEIFRIAQRINSQVYKPVEIYTALAVLFLIVCLPLHGLAHWLRVRYTRDFSES
jgi:His/Glu/Gln/Arg/opine family amino acid ABC transporter permease subunit